ncbi:branched-chain amino acid ABC transporter permease [Nocardioides immobilis]|nr:branched-chain amino acid ABC transporter permease [Nocardioides immobilis]
MTTIDQTTSRPTQAVIRGVALALIGVAVCVAPLYLDTFWLRTGLTVASAAVGAIGLTILVGTTGQLSFAHPFLMAGAAVTYVTLADNPVNTAHLGLGLPPAAAAVLAIFAAGALGLAASPLASRLSGIYLGIATLSLVFIGQHILENWTAASGGFFGRPVPPMSLFGLSLADSPTPPVLLGVPLQREELLWYLSAAVIVVAWIAGRNVVHSRVGRSLAAVRDSEVLAATNGVNVRSAKRGAYIASSMFAGAAGVLFALTTGSVAPETFNLGLAISFLAMVVVGGLGSVAGACMGAAFIAGLPLLLQEFSDQLPLIVQTGEAGGMQASTATSYLAGALIVLCMLFEPRGLVGLATRGRSLATRALRRTRILTSRATHN